MIEFKIKKDQINRLKVLNDYIKKMENISPISDKQTFILNKDKLNIYGIATTASAGHIESVYDVESKDETSFMLELNKFITYLEKIKSDEMIVSINKDKMTIKSKTSKTEINQALAFTAPEQSVLDEIKDNIKNKLTLPEFKTPIEIKLDAKNIMTDIGAMTKLQNTNYEIMVGKDYVKTADYLCIVKIKTDAIATEDDILIDREIISLFKGVNSFKISSDKKYFYFDIVDNGIKILFVPKTYSWSYPTEQDLTDICPIDSKQIEIEVNTEKFYNMLDEFSGVFDSSCWKYEQINMKTPKGFNSSKELELHFDNIDVEVRTKLPVEIKSDTDKTDDFEFMIPTQHFKLLKESLSKEDSFIIKYSSTKIDEPNGISILIENKNIKVIIAKMIP